MSRHFPISFWRTASGSEVDLILGDAEVAIDIKSTERVAKKAKGIHLFREEHKCKKSFIVSREPVPRKLPSDITILPIRDFCEMLWAGQIL